MLGRILGIALVFAALLLILLLTGISGFLRVLVGVLFTRLAGDGPIEQRLLTVWEDLSAPENHPFLRLFFQQFGTAMRDRDGWDAFTDRIAHEWIDATAEVLRRDGFGAADARVAATQLVGFWRGLQFLTLTGVDPDELRAANRATVHALLTRR